MREHMGAVADLALELISSAFGRGQDDFGADDKRIIIEARAVDAIRRGDLQGEENAQNT